MPRGELQITLKYNGVDVDDGTMPVADVVSALQGFASAYSKLASRHDPNGQHQLRVVAIDRSSFALFIAAWASQNQATLLTASAAATKWVVARIAAYIELKKAVKGDAYSVNVEGDGNTYWCFREIIRKSPSRQT